MRTIVLTGDSRGVGHSIAKELLKNDYRVIGISRQSSNQIDCLANEYGSDKYIHLNYDLADVDGVKKLYREKLRSLTKETGIYGFVNNAAMAYDDIITNLNYSALSQMYKVNVFSPMMLTKYVLRDMLLSKVACSIVHISSISAHTGYKGLAMYASTKGAIEAFSKNTAREWGGLGVRSNVVCPGFMDTEMSATLNDDQKNRIFNRNSMKKPVEVEAVAKTVCFLLGEGANCISGDIIHVDNGTI
ncbi:SDR family oxidoreductase [Tenacibaculum ascidiaceicola]|uniref:SDR family oxidoreductase n=1 Tax=Tenacibaculum ascidiaceicola TaxID=1699411 RepID=UPI003CE55C2E